MHNFKNILKGIAIGSGAILPGISSGVLCVIFGMYEKLVNSVLGFFNNIKENTKFLWPIVLGCVIGILVFSNVLQYCLDIYSIQTKAIFIGLIIGSVPALIKDVNKKTKFKIKYLVFTIVSIIIGLAGVYLENKGILNYDSNNTNYFYLVFSGFLMSIGVVFPGVSSTVILMLLGIYATYLKAISGLDFEVLIPIGIGLIAGCLIFMKITRWLLKHYYAQTFYSIIGFTIGSIFVLIPDVRCDMSLLIFVLCVLMGVYLINVIEK